MVAPIYLEKNYCDCLPGHQAEILQELISHLKQQPTKFYFCQNNRNNGSKAEMLLVNIFIRIKHCDY